MPWKLAIKIWPFVSMFWGLIFCFQSYGLKAETNTNHFILIKFDGIIVFLLKMHQTWVKVLRVISCYLRYQFTNHRIDIWKVTKNSNKMIFFCKYMIFWVLFLNRVVLFEYHRAVVPFCWAVRPIGSLSTLQ